MKHEQLWNKETRANVKNTVYSRLIGFALLIVSLAIFAVSGGAADDAQRGILLIGGVGLIALAFTILITGVNRPSDRDDKL